MEIVAVLLFWIVWAIIGAAVGSQKNAAATGCLLGLLLGPLGAVVAYFADYREKCYLCGERINVGAKVCAHCRRSVSDPRMDVEELDAYKRDRAEMTRSASQQPPTGQKITPPVQSEDEFFEQIAGE